MNLSFTERFNQMKILAVIPARAGSKGIPNKNIRLINGHPLIYYSIKNALDSEYITDVVVSTDSDYIRIIAQQMGVTCHWRDAELCGDAVTLDAVIYDVAKDKPEFDYVVTMQPTSPTLKVSSLDAAIESAIKEDWDTVISVTNAPHLSWKEEDGRVVPNYTERLNRQYLPANYLETGAFVVSKKSVVTPKGRIGEKVSVYEISEEEAIDIDTFMDLHLVTEILNRKQVAIYVNGNKQRGTGHIYRALELADEFLVKPDIYYDINQTDREIFGETTHNIIPVNGIVELFEKVKSVGYEIFINDILDTSVDYMIALRTVMPKNGKIINFEDDGEGSTKANLVFNALFEKSENPKAFTGEKYYIAPKMFMLYNPVEIREQAKKVFICFGGADPSNYTDQILEIISQDKYKNTQFVIALGRAKDNVDELMKFNDFENIEVLYNVTNMPELMSQCDVAITSRGRTAYELAMLGIPSIVLSQNEREENHSFVSNENGFYFLGTNPSRYMMESALDLYLSMPQEERQRLQKTLLEADLKSGRSRVIGLIKNV